MSPRTIEEQVQALRDELNDLHAVAADAQAERDALKKRLAERGE